MANNPMKEIADVLNDIHTIDVDVEDDTLVEEFMDTLGAIDWKLWEILKLLQKFDEDEDEEEKSDDK
jgi:hypothetical protein